MLIGIWYHWDRVVIDYKHQKENVDYLYYPSITDDDVVEYLTPSVLREDEEKIYRRAIRHTLDYVHYDNLEDDEFFYEFLKKKYEEQAKEQCIETEIMLEIEENEKDENN